jgi:hypothetical protein
MSYGVTYGVTYGVLSMSTVYMGIDPGASGAIAILDPHPKLSYVTHYNLASLSDSDIWHKAFVRWKSVVTHAMLEEIPTAIFGTGKSSMSKLYGSYKMLEGFLIAADIEYGIVPAKIWQRTMGIEVIPKEKSTDHKKRLLQHARRLYHKFQCNITKDNCDAFMLADYAHKVYQYQE